MEEDNKYLKIAQLLNGLRDRDAQLMKEIENLRNRNYQLMVEIERMRNNETLRINEIQLLHFEIQDWEEKFDKLQS